ncbi:MAG: hypothetical protein U9Q08_04815 [Candidatus Omnitrophota bacterium]|nr:hypothetical protein [Candidatus Omnitrophota bacterium]
MIRLDLTTAVSIYQFITVFGILTIWIIVNCTKKRKLTDQDNAFRQCSVCTRLYLVDKDQDITRCPGCKSYNKRADNLASDFSANLGSSRAKSRADNEAKL